MAKNGRKLTRREFLSSAAVLVGGVVILPGHLLAQSASDVGLEARLAQDPMRPQFHLLPAKNWMNDPNGPIYFKGKYHMFFQYDPRGPVWGDMSWGHAVSPDMIHWTHLPVALTPTPDGPDAFGCFSGSASAVGNRVYAVYTGTKKSGAELATIRDGTNNIQESQCLTWSDDQDLVRWTKDPQPIVPRPPAGMNITGFRDPSVWRQGDCYYMTVGSGIENVGGCVLLYRCKATNTSTETLRKWEYLHKLTSGQWDGKKTSNPCDDGEMWECPEFFPLDGGHVLIYSTLGKVFWESGVLDEAAMTFKPGKKGELDLGAFYAPKTQLDAHGQRILWGWIQEHRSESAMRAAGWSGMMSLPRVLNLDQDGNLRIRTLPQLATLRIGTIKVARTFNGGKAKVPRATGEVLCSGAAGKAFTLTMSNGEELINVSYSPEKHTFTCDDKETALGGADSPTVHAFVDGSVIELILGERVGFTKRFYFNSPTAPDVLVSATGVGLTLEAWNIKPISENRLTTPARTT